MSITVAVNATESTNGSQAVCQATQHNNCCKYNGGGDDDDDMAVFDHEKDQHEQVPIITFSFNVLEDERHERVYVLGFDNIPCR